MEPKQVFQDFFSDFVLVEKKLKLANDNVATEKADVVDRLVSRSKLPNIQNVQRKTIFKQIYLFFLPMFSLSSTFIIL